MLSFSELLFEPRSHQWTAPKMEGMSSRKLQFSSSTPMAQAGQLHFVRRDISLKQITKCRVLSQSCRHRQSSTWISLWVSAELQVQGCPHHVTGSWGAELLPGTEAWCLPVWVSLGLAGQIHKSRTSFELWLPAQPADGNTPLCRNLSCIACEQALSAHTVTACSDNVDLFDFAGSGMSIGLPGPPGPPGSPGVSYSDLTAYLRSKLTSSLPCHGALHALTALITEFPFLPIITNNPLKALCP